MSDEPNYPPPLPYSIQQYQIWANQRAAREARAARFAQHVDDIAVDGDVTFISPVRRSHRQKPPPIICPSQDISDIYDAADIVCEDGTTLAERLARHRPEND